MQLLLLIIIVLKSVKSATLTGSIFDCGGTDDCYQNTIQCEANKDCTVTCGHKDYACDGTQIYCPERANCMVDCTASYYRVCRFLDVFGRGSDSLTLNCATNAANFPCLTSTVYCPYNGKGGAAPCTFTGYIQADSTFNIYAVEGFNDVDLTQVNIDNTWWRIMMYCGSRAAFDENYSKSCSLSTSKSCPECSNIIEETAPPTTDPTTTSPTANPVGTDSTKSFCCSHRCRKEWSTLDQAAKNLYASGFKNLSDQGITQKMTQSHRELQQTRAGIHGNETFLPWHRAFIYDLESKIRGLGGDYKCFGLPYWDSTSGEKLKILNSGLGGNGIGTDKCVTDADALNVKPEYEPDSKKIGECLSRDVKYGVFPVCDRVDAAYVMNITQKSSYSEIWSAIEIDPHGYPHGCIGGSMADPGYSPDDPIFYLHHTMVDYMFALWQDYQNYDVGSVESWSDRYYGSIKQKLRMPHNSDSSTTLTVEDVYDIGKLTVIYEKGPFWVNSNMNDLIKNYNIKINDSWFYVDGTTGRRLVTSQEASQSIYDQLVASGAYDNAADLIHAWSVQSCEWQQTQSNGKICEIPKEFDDCLNMTINPETNDIDVTLEELLSKDGITDCMKNVRVALWDLASQFNTKLKLCAGCYDTFCNKTSFISTCRSMNTQSSAGLNIYTTTGVTDDEIDDSGIDGLLGRAKQALVVWLILLFFS
eukprot:2900_1